LPTKTVGVDCTPSWSPSALACLIGVVDAADAAKASALAESTPAALSMLCRKFGVT
jgi:hypothetical protein